MTLGINARVPQHGITKFFNSKPPDPDPCSSSVSRREKNFNLAYLPFNNEAIELNEFKLKTTEIFNFSN
ncbi:hypothetical protein BpHYR1_052395 [Brachionus plicatilis]|uniref:Uncharacterized protein n=1 Tax=Brachionus plicatilis TaxID=10195 RepID=A0A3M7SWV5_BRAPC|nr:hypothetical protein BpHYR1_052395 [Brachionus plicatilis]